MWRLLEGGTYEKAALILIWVSIEQHLFEAVRLLVEIR